MIREQDGNSLDMVMMINLFFLDLCRYQDRNVTQCLLSISAMYKVVHILEKKDIKTSNTSVRRKILQCHRQAI